MYEDDLAKVPLFADLGKRELQRIGAVCREQSYAPGEPLVWQGAPGTGFFVITAGKVRIMQQRADGDTRQLNVLGPGDTFGEMALLDGGARAATVTTVLPTRLVVFEGHVLDALVDAVPVVAKRLLMQTSKRLRSADALASIEAPASAPTQL